jgi:hypothetical protein
MAFCNAAPEKKEEIIVFQQQLVRLFSLLFGCALTQLSSMETNRFELLNLDGFDGASLRFLQQCPDKCEVTLQWIQRLIVESEQKQILKIAPPILSRVYNELGNGIVNLNNARKIKEFPIPFPLAQMIMVMLVFHAVVTPLICAATLPHMAWACILTFIITFSYWSVLYIALELEMPYGDDANDLPLHEMAESMNASLRQMMDPLACHVPKFDESQLVGKDLRYLCVDLDGDLSISARHGSISAVSPRTEEAHVTDVGVMPPTRFASVDSDATAITIKQEAPPMSAIPQPAPLAGGQADSKEMVMSFTPFMSAPQSTERCGKVDTIMVESITSASPRAEDSVPAESRHIDGTAVLPLTVNSDSKGDAKDIPGSVESLSPSFPEFAVISGDSRSLPQTSTALSGKDGHSCSPLTAVNRYAVNDPT